MSTPLKIKKSLSVVHRVLWRGHVLFWLILAFGLLVTPSLSKIPAIGLATFFTFYGAYGIAVELRCPRPIDLGLSAPGIAKFTFGIAATLNLLFGLYAILLWHMHYDVTRLFSALSLYWIAYLARPIKAKL